jgi:hypothetical protein
MPEESLAIALWVFIFISVGLIIMKQWHRSPQRDITWHG